MKTTLLRNIPPAVDDGDSVVEDREDKDNAVPKDPEKRKAYLLTNNN